MAEQWYVSVGGDKKGPYSRQELQDWVDQGRVLARDLVWCEGMPDWTPARTMFEPSGSRVRRRDEEDDLEMAPRTVRPSGSEDFPRRLISPGFFFLCVLMFFLPWVNVSCQSFTVVSQSGLQICIGDYSESFLVEQERGGRGNPAANDKPAPAPFIIAYIVLILLGIMLGLCLRCGMTRGILLGLCAAGGVALLLIQMAIGFPLEVQVAKANADPQVREELRRHGVFDPLRLPLNPLNPPRPEDILPQIVGGPGAGPAPALRLRPTPWFWTTVFLTTCGLLGLGLEQIGGGRREGRRRNRD